MKDSQRLKDMIIYNVLSYLKTKDVNLKLSVINDLKQFSAYYHVKIKKVERIDLFNALMIFIKNDDGYNVTINKLNSSLS